MQARTALQVFMEDRLMDARHDMERVRESLARRDPRTTIRNARQRVDELHIRLGQGQGRYLRRQRERLTSRLSTLNAVRAESVLGRGYALVTRRDGALVTRAEQVKDGEQVTIRWHDGTHTARIGDPKDGYTKKPLL